jgi:type III secretion protein D
VSVRGYVESRERRMALQQALARVSHGVSLSVVSADEMVEQARRFVSDPGVTIAYAGQGRLVVSGTVEDDAVRQQIRRLGEDLHPLVLVSDKVTYKPKPVREAVDDGAAARTQWAAWQDVLPSRMVGITEDANGLRHIQLANGNRYYEGSLLRSGAELQRIDTDGLVLRGGESPDKKERRR